MKKYTTLLFTFLLGTALYAQEPKWTLRECIEFAIENNIKIKQQELQVKSAEVDLNSSKNDRLPDLNVGIGQSFNFGRSISQTTNTYESATTSGTAWQATSSTNIFSGFKISNNIKAKEFSLKAAIEGLKKAKDNIQIEITSYYLDVLYKKELLNVYIEQAKLTQNQVDKTQILYEGGKVPLSQVYDIKSQLASNNLSITNAQNDLNNSRLALSQALNLTYSPYFDVESPDPNSIVMTDGSLSSLTHPDLVYERAIVIKPHIKEAQLNIESSKKNLKVAESGYWPTLNLELGYKNGYQKLYNSDNNISFGDQIRNNRNEYITLTLAIPIFDRFVTRNAVRKAKLDIQNQMLELDNVKIDLYKEIFQAYTNAVAAQAKYKSTTKAYESAAIAFQFAEESYKAGKMTVFEYNETVSKLITSQFEQVQSKYDFLFRSKILDFYQGQDIDI